MAAGKPYYTFRSSFSAVPESYLRSAMVVSSAAELDVLLADGIEPDGNAILQDLCAAGDFPNASERTWQIIEDAVGYERPESASPEPEPFEPPRPIAK